MLIPAICRADEIVANCQAMFYTEDMFHMTGYTSDWTPNIEESNDGSCKSYAIINNSKENKLIGYLGYCIDYRAKRVDQFGLISFDKGNPIVGRDTFEHLKYLCEHYHTVSWRMVGGNPAERGYDKFLSMYDKPGYGTSKLYIPDALMDLDGVYVDDIIYQVTNFKVV